MPDIKTVALSGLAAMLFCAPPLFAQTPPSKAQLTKFLDQASKDNKMEEAEGSLAIIQAGRDLPLKSFGSMLKADHRVNEEAVQSLAAVKNVSLTHTTMPAPAEKLEHMTRQPLRGSTGRQRNQGSPEGDSEVSASRERIPGRSAG